jgi:hypothetical protein
VGGKKVVCGLGGKGERVYGGNAGFAVIGDSKCDSWRRFRWDGDGIVILCNFASEKSHGLLPEGGS